MASPPSSATDPAGSLKWPPAAISSPCGVSNAPENAPADAESTPDTESDAESTPATVGEAGAAPAAGAAGTVGVAGAVAPRARRTLRR